MDPVIGIDFDNTIINYDELLFRLAVRAGFIPSNARKSKKFIRDTIRTLPDGEIEWQKLQAVMYGPAIGDAGLNEGVTDFIRACRDRGFPVSIVSHKTPHSNLLGPAAVNFRDAATRWMRDHGFFQTNGLGLSEANVFYESTREEKVARIAALGCTHFIDDLEETFLEPTFPAGVARLLYNAHGETCAAPDVKICTDWRQVGAAVFAPRVTSEEADAARTAATLLGCPVGPLTKIGGGRNSRVYRVETPAGPRYALKLYFRHGQDTRDRRATEYAALEFLRKNGVHSVAEPLVTDANLGASIFSFVEGTVASPAEATPEDMDRLANFLLELRCLSHRPEAATLPVASEAMFSLDSLVENIDSRLQRLRAVEGTEETYAQLTQYLEQEFRPTFAQIVQWGVSLLDQHGLGRGQELAQEARTLSPSDFGFHNALRTPDGGLVFVDFEYFGWDDPAKMVSDFLLHPGMALSQPLRGRFLNRLLRGFGKGHALDVRVRVAFGLYALKWCMILLNEFVPEHLQRRLFAKPGLKPADLQRQQLAKARDMLTLARNARVAFPYEEWMCQ